MSRGLLQRRALDVRRVQVGQWEEQVRDRERQGAQRDEEEEEEEEEGAHPVRDRL